MTPLFAFKASETAQVLATKASKSVKLSGSPKDKLVLLHFTDVEGACKRGRMRKRCHW